MRNLDEWHPIESWGFVLIETRRHSSYFPDLLEDPWSSGRRTSTAAEAGSVYREFNFASDLLDRLMSLHSGQSIWFWSLLTMRQRASLAFSVGLRDLAAEAREAGAPLAIESRDIIAPFKLVVAPCIQPRWRWAGSRAASSREKVIGFPLDRWQHTEMNTVFNAFQRSSMRPSRSGDALVREAFERSVAFFEFDQGSANDASGPIIPTVGVLALPAALVRGLFGPDAGQRLSPPPPAPRAADGGPPSPPSPEPPRSRLRPQTDAPTPCATPAIGSGTAGLPGPGMEGLSVRGAKAIEGWITTGELGEALGKGDARAGRDWCIRHGVPYRRDGKFNWLRLEDVDRAIRKLPETGRAAKSSEDRELAATIATMTTQRRRSA